MKKLEDYLLQINELDRISNSSGKKRLFTLEKHLHQLKMKLYSKKNKNEFENLDVQSSYVDNTVPQNMTTDKLKGLVVNLLRQVVNEN